MNHRRQVPYPLYAPVLHEFADVPGTCHWVQVSTYVADFVWIDGSGLVVADKKGKRTQIYALKRKWLELQQGIVILEV